MADTAADVMIQCLLDWGVDTVFGIPGDGVNGVIESFRKRKGEIRAGSPCTWLRRWRRG